jgi:alkylhydroperoxidase family enzyme
MTTKQAFLPLIGRAEAEGGLKAIYEQFARGGASRPAVYQTATGEVANIIRAHSLDPEGLRLAFGASGAIHWGPSALPWAEREMINTVTSRANNCFY